MLLPPSIFSRSLTLAAIVWVLVTCSVPAVAQQPEPPPQLPEEIRGAKIYQLPTKGGQPAPNPAVYKSIGFQDINFERLLLSLSISIRPVDRAATVERIYFQDVRVNGIPVHIETFEKEFKLSNKQTVDLPAPLNCSIIFADLDSLKPVQDMVDQDKIQITGQSFVEVKLSSLEKLAVRAKQLVIPSSLNEQVPLNLFQGNPLLRMTADTILAKLADPSSAAALNMAKEHLAKMHQDQTVGAVVKPALYLLYTQYAVRDPKTKATEVFSQSGTGFLVSKDGKMLTTKRVVEPWKFDSPVAFLLQNLHLELDKDSVKTYAWPAGAQVIGADGQPDFQSALSTEKQTLKVLQTSPDQMTQQVYQDPDSAQQATLSLHAEGESDLALLQLTGTDFHPLAFLEAAPDLATNPNFVLCGYPFGASQPQTAPRLLGVKVQLQEGATVMDHQADAGESGAPLLNAEGKVVAMAASGHQCISIQTARKLVP